MGTRVFADGQVGNFEETGMSYPDFIFFMLSEEDKSSVCALRYWYVFYTFSVICCGQHADINLLFGNFAAFAFTMFAARLHHFFLRCVCLQWSFSHSSISVFFV